MDFKKLKIETIVNIKGKMSFGITKIVTDEQINQSILKELKSTLINKDIKIKTSDGQINAKIMKIDAYQSNYNYNLLNIFFLTNISSLIKIQVGDEISVIE